MKEYTPEQYYKLHQQAFRIAFDFLNEHFPPEHFPEWWERTANDVTLIGNQYGENPAVPHLIAAMFEYLEETDRRRQEHGAVNN